jgi:hypothetical protein
MKTEFWIEIIVKGVNVRLLATINHTSYCGWRIEKLTYVGMMAGVAIYYTPTPLTGEQLVSANAQIEHQLKLEQTK